jgi:hypothetical protein
MSDSNNVVSRVAVGLFFAAIAAGGYAFMTHNSLEAAENKLAAVERERAHLKTELLATERTFLASSTAAKTCTKELQAYKTRAQSTGNAVPDSKPKQSKSRSAS